MTPPAAIHLTDFGLAKNVATGSRLTRSGETLGTPAYMSPEQARGEVSALTERSDVWSLACVLFELLSGGRRAFEAETPAAIVGRVITGRPAPLRDLAPGLPNGVAQLVEAGLAQAPGHRPPDAAAFRDACARLLRGEPPGYRAPRSRRPLVVAAVLAAAAGVAAAGWWAGSGRPPPPAPVQSAAGAGDARRGWALRRDDPGAGTALLAEALRADPSQQTWRVRHGLLLWATGRHDAAQQAWAAVPPAAAERAEARLYMGLETLFRALDLGGPAQNAVPPLREAMASGGRVGTLARAALETFSGRRSAALRRLESVPGWEASLLVALALDAGDPENTTPTIRAYDRALADGPTFAWVLNNRGVCRWKQGDHARALADYQASLTIAPADAMALANLGAVHNALGDQAAAWVAYTAAIAAKADFKEAYVNRGRIRIAQERFQEARHEFQAALDIDPEYRDALMGRGVARHRLGDSAEAIADFTEAARIDPGHAPAFYNRGMVRAALNDLAGAIDDQTAALKIDPGLKEALHERGQARSRQGDLAGCAEDQTAALAIDPHFQDALVARGVVRVQLRRFKEAAEDLSLALDAEPHDGAIKGYRGIARGYGGDVDGAIRDFTEILASDHPAMRAWADSAHVNRGMMHEQRRDYAAAIADYEQALELMGPDWDQRPQVLGFLQRARAAAQRKQ